MESNDEAIACIYCGGVAAPDAKHCPSCGRALPPRRRAASSVRVASTGRPAAAIGAPREATPHASPGAPPDASREGAPEASPDDFAPPIVLDIPKRGGIAKIVPYVLALAMLLGAGAMIAPTVQERLALSRLPEAERLELQRKALVVDFLRTWRVAGWKTAARMMDPFSAGPQREMESWKLVSFGDPTYLGPREFSQSGIFQGQVVDGIGSAGGEAFQAAVVLEEEVASGTGTGPGVQTSLPMRIIVSRDAQRVMTWDWND